jgi:hypothetical protein
MTFREFWTSDVIPMRYLSYVFLPFTSLAGGIVFAMTGSWWKAVCCDAYAFVLLFIIAIAAHFIIDTFVALLQRLGFPIDRPASLKF